MKSIIVSILAAASAFGWYTSQPPPAVTSPAPAAQSAPQAAPQAQPGPGLPASFTVTYNGPGGSWTRPATGGIPDPAGADVFRQWKIVPVGPNQWTFVLASETPIPSEILMWSTTGPGPRVNVCYHAAVKMWFTSIDLSSGGFSATPYGTFGVGGATVTVGP